MATARAVLLIG